MKFSYAAIDRRGQRRAEMLEAPDLAAAQQDLTQRGLFVLELESHEAGRSTTLVGKPPVAPGDPPSPETRAPGSLADASGSVRAPSARPRELLLFARQMAMLQRAGASVVPAIHAVAEQPGRAGWQVLLNDLADNVEGGLSLQEALARHPRCFSGVVCSIVGAGEATGTLADSFTRLSDLLETRQRLRKRIIGALSYPCALLLLAAGVVATMMLFVLPRFTSLFAMLDVDLPAITRLMLAAGDGIKTWWPLVFGPPAAAITGLVFWSRTAPGRRTLGRLILRVPLFGRAVGGVILSQLLLVWAALLRSHVSVLETITQTRGITSNVVFARLIVDVEQAVTEGRSISGVLRQSNVVPAPVVSAIAVGEDSGRLGESMEFVGNWVEEDANGLIASLTRLLEPAILVFMGLVVGAVSVSLFLPLFEIATAAG